MDGDSDFSERKLWERSLPDWAVTLFLAPFADESGALTATLAWTARCLLGSLLLVVLLPDGILDAVTSSALFGGAAVLLLAAACSARVP